MNATFNRFDDSEAESRSRGLLESTEESWHEVAFPGK